MWNTRVNESSASRPDSSIVILQIGLDEYFTTFDPRVSVRGTPEARVFWGLIRARLKSAKKKAMFDGRQRVDGVFKKIFTARKIEAYVSAHTHEPSSEKLDRQNPIADPSEIANSDNLKVMKASTRASFRLITFSCTDLPYFWWPDELITSHLWVIKRARICCDFPSRIFSLVVGLKWHDKRSIKAPFES